MPRVIFPSKRVIINKDTKEIMRIFDAAIKKYKEKEGSLSSLSHNEASQKDSTFITNRLKLLEELTGKVLGADKIDLPESEHHLSADAYLLYTQYQNFLVNILMDHKGKDTYNLLTKKKISNRSVLLTHLLLMLAAEGLDENQQSKTNNLILKIMDNFFDELIEGKVFEDRGILAKKYFTGFGDKLFRTHNKWQLIFKSRIEAIQQLNKNKDIINQALEELIRLRHALVAMIISECGKLIKKDLPSKQALHECFLDQTFHYFLFGLNIDGLKPFIDKFQIEMTELPFQFEQESLKELFDLLAATNKLAKITEKLSNIVIGAGWFPFMAGIIQTGDFSNKFSVHVNASIALINKLLEEPFGKTFKNLDVAILRNKNLKLFKMHLESITVVDGLTELNNPKLLSQLSSRFQADILELLALQNDISCTLIDKNKIQQLMGTVTVKSNNDDELATLESIKTSFKKATEVIESNPVGADELFSNIILSTEPIVKYLEFSLFQKGVLLFQDKDYQAALDCFNAIRFMEDDKLFYNKGLCHLGLNNIEEAKIQFRQIKENKELSAKADLLLKKKSTSSSPARKFSLPPSPSLSFFAPKDTLLVQFESFRYGAKVDDRVQSRKLEITKECSKEEMKSIIKSDVKNKDKKVYIYSKKENDKLEWHYFYALNDGNDIIRGQIDSQLVPNVLNEYYSKPEKNIFPELKKYLLTILLDKKFRAEFAKKLELASTASREELSHITEMTEDSDSLRMDSL